MMTTAPRPVLQAEITVVVPTRNRTVLAKAALRSVLDQRQAGIRVLVSDNSTSTEERTELAAFCRTLPVASVRYVRPPRPLPMAQHWEWAMETAKTMDSNAHFTVLTDRMLFQPGALRHLLDIVAASPLKVVSYNFDQIEDAQWPIRLHQVQWSGQIFEIRSRHLLSLASRAKFPQATPRLLNCVVPSTVLKTISARFGDVCTSIAPDYSFAYRCLATQESVLYWDRAPMIAYAVDRSNGSSYARGILSEDARDFLGELRDQRINQFAPIPEFRTNTNMILNEYCFVRSKAASENFPEVDLVEYLKASALDISRIDDQELSTSQKELLLQYGGRALPSGARDSWARMVRILKRGPLPLLHRTALRLVANRATQPLWSRLGFRPPASPWFTFASPEQAVQWAFRFPRRRGRSSDLAALGIRYAARDVSGGSVSM